MPIPGTIAIGLAGPGGAGRGLNGDPSVSPSGTGTMSGPNSTSISREWLVASVMAPAAGFGCCTELSKQAAVCSAPKSAALQTNPTTRTREIRSSVKMPLAASRVAAGGGISLFASMTHPCEQMGCQAEIACPA
jgi:hypothetical protein